MTLWWAKDASLVRQRLDAIGLALYTGTGRAVRIYAPARTKVNIGEIVRINCSVRELNGRPALWTDTFQVIQPEE